MLEESSESVNYPGDFVDERKENGNGNGAHTETLSPNGQAALAYTEADLSVVPLCWPNEKGACGCWKHHTPKEVGKAPLLGEGYEKRRLTRAQVMLWWLCHPLANVGILLEPGGFLVIDSDSPEADREVEQRGVPPGPRVTTPHGIHRYFSANGSAGRTTKQGESSKIDVLAAGYAVAPPSRTPAGSYRWEYTLTDIEIEEAPAWAVDLLAQAKTKAEPITLDGDLVPVELATLGLDGWLVEVIQTGQTSHPDKYPSRSEAIFAAITGLLHAGCSVETIASILLDPRYVISEKPREQGQNWLLKDIARAQAKRWTIEEQPEMQHAHTAKGMNGQTHYTPESEPFEDDAGDPEDEGKAEAKQAAPKMKAIQVNNRELRNISADAQQALLVKNTPPFLFVRSGQIARIVTDECERPLIETVGEAAMRGYLTRAADFVQVSAKGKTGEKPAFLHTRVSPPRDIVQDILSLPRKPFPPLLGVVESPVLRPDGSIFSTAGYDTATRLFYHPTSGFTLPRVADRPTAEEARQARQWLHEELLSDFPFVEDADLTNCFATFLTPIVRPAIRGNTPLALIDKPAPGSGASLITDVLGTITNGEHAAKLKAPDGRNAEEEWRKRITAFLLDGSPIGVIDNIEDDALSSASLSILLTAGVWKDRILGTNTMVTLPVRACFIATGNNLTLRGDLPRRCFRVRLDSEVEKPWEREGFKHPDLLDWAQKNRGKLLAALLTMARAWFANGQPASEKKLPKLGGFEQWIRIIGGILTFSGLSGFLGNQQALYDLVDDQAPQWRAFLSAWFDQFGERWITVRYFAGTLLGLPAESPLVQSLPETLEWDSEKLDSSRQKLGIALKKQAFRVYGHYKLERGGKDEHAKVAEWRVIQR